MKKILSYSWLVMANLISLAVITGIIVSTSEQDNGLIYPILILIYLSIKSTALGLGESILELSVGLGKQFFAVKQLIKNEDANDDDTEIDDRYSEINKQMMIKKVFLLLSYIVAVGGLLGTLGS